MNENVLVLIFDKVAGLYSMPVAFTNVACAKRYFVQLGEKNANYEDLELYLVATISAETGVIQLLPEKQFLMRGGVSE